jgi:hypothetical protein
MIVRSLPRRIVMGAFALSLTSACGTAFVITPLLGDPPEVGQILESPAAVSETPITVAAVERFYRALVVRSEAIAFEARSSGPRDSSGELRGGGDLWPLLSSAAQEALDGVAGSIGSTGRALLQTARFPRAGAKSASDTVEVSLVALFLVRRPLRFRATDLAPAGNTSSVVVEARDGTKATVPLVFERGEWRIDHRDFSNVAAAATVRVGQLGRIAPSVDPEDAPLDLPEAAPVEPEPTPEAPPNKPTRPGGLDF